MHISEMKAMIVAKDGVVKGEFINLEDKTCSVFTAGTLMDLARYRDEVVEDAEVFVSKEGVSVYRNEPFNRYTKPVAKYQFVTHPVLRLITGVLGKKVSLETLEDFCRRVKKYSPDCAALWNNVRSFSKNKILKMERSKDNRGNYNFRMSIEDSGKQDWLPPEAIRIECPLLEHHDDLISLDIDFSVNYRMSEESVSVLVEMDCLDVQELIEKVRMAVVKKHIGDVYFGECEIIRGDDSWKYLPNAVKIG